MKSGNGEWVMGNGNSGPLLTLSSGEDKGQWGMGKSPLLPGSHSEGLIKVLDNCFGKLGTLQRRFHGWRH
jgi:hypothetical protein